jgi:hypothetical protein
MKLDVSTTDEISEPEYLGQTGYTISVELPERKTPRACGDCTKCCEGFLTSTIYGHMMYPGKPCHFKTEGKCGIYNNRPYDPCVTFACAWLADMQYEIPEWMKPTLSNVILTMGEWGEDKQPYLIVTECGKKLDSAVLWWVFNYSQSKNISLAFQLDGGWNFYGPKEFIDAISNKNPIMV